MNLIVFLFFLLPVAGQSACRSDAPARALDPANYKTITDLQRALAKPAREETSFCLEDLGKKKEDIRGWLVFLDQDIDFLTKSEEEWANEILGRKIPAGSPKALACGQERDLTELSDFYERAQTRMDEFNGKLNSVAVALLTVRAEKEIFAHPKLARRLIECRDEFREQSEGLDEEELDPDEATERRDVCLSRTGATPELWEAVKHMEKYSSGTAAGLACVLDPKARREVKKNLDLAKRIEKDAKKLLMSANNYFEGLNKNIPTRAARIADIRIALDPWKCSAWLAAEDVKTESATRKLQAAEGHGTGFVLNGPGGKKELISARHVGFQGDGFAQPSSLTLQGPYAGTQPRRGIQFEVKPGFYDRGRDLIKHPLSSAKTAFTAVPAGTVTAPGEKVRIFGYPANRDGLFSSHRCEVKGIGRNNFDTPSSESYLLYCPGAESHIGGMSGGPVTNSKGEVIGVVSAHNPFTNIVVVQPVSRDAEGENRFGFQAIFHAPVCFADAGISKPKPCQVIPGLTFEKSIP